MDKEIDVIKEEGREMNKEYNDINIVLSKRLYNGNIIKQYNKDKKRKGLMEIDLDDKKLENENSAEEEYDKEEDNIEDVVDDSELDRFRRISKDGICNI